MRLGHSVTNHHIYIMLYAVWLCLLLSDLCYNSIGMSRTFLKHLLGAVITFILSVKPPLCLGLFTFIIHIHFSPYICSPTLVVAFAWLPLCYSHITHCLATPVFGIM